MKRFLCFLVAVSMMVLCCVSVVSAADKVEISFCVGDSTLLINSTEMTVEKPYVVGAGVTLVPIRVITEAFGAKVDWIAETKTVKLDYPGVNIVIQIGNSVAEVNGKAETLLAPPELSKGGYTMIPLRFISENFGAVVSYDDATGRITVVKDNVENSTLNIGDAVNSKFVGDSYYKWSMENPHDMTMDERSFDGLETTFVEGENEISISISKYDEDFNFESQYNNIKQSFSDYTLVKNEKDTSDKNCLKMHLAGKDKTAYVDFQAYVTPEYVYLVIGYLSNEDASVRDKYINILSTFACEFKNSDIYDLSNVKDGFRTFNSDSVKLSIDIPENYSMSTSEDAETSFEFEEIDDGVGSIVVVVYSKSDVESAQALANEDFNHNKVNLNEKLVEFSESVSEKQYEKFSAFEYSYTYTTKKSKVVRDVFFELGDYVYNVAVTVAKDREDGDAFTDNIINSVTVEKLDSNEVGILMKNSPEETGKIDIKFGNAVIKVPNIYRKVINTEDSSLYTGTVNGVIVSVSTDNASGITIPDVRKTLTDSLKEMEDDSEDFERIVDVSEKTINGKKFYGFVAKSTQDEETMYIYEYVSVYNSKLYLVMIVCSELAYSEKNKTEIDGILNSITIK